MNPCRRLFRSASRKSSYCPRPPQRLRAQLRVEGLESRLVPANLVPLTGGQVPELAFVVPLSQPVDSSHFHSLAAAAGTVAAGSVVTIEPGASPDYLQPVSVTTSGITIQGDPNVPASILPSNQLDVNASNVTLLNLNLSSVTLGDNNPGLFSGNHVSKCLIGNLTEDTAVSTFTQNTITGFAEFQGDGHRVNNDVITNNTFTSTFGVPLSINSCLGDVVAQNSLYASGSGIGIAVSNSGAGTFPITIANNTVSIAEPAPNCTGISVDQSPAGNVLVKILNNTIQTSGQGTGLAISAATDALAVLAQGNDFHSNAVGVSINYTQGQPPATVDLGGGPFGGLGGNNFRGFTQKATATAAAITGGAPAGTFVANVLAEGNMFASGIDPNSVVYPNSIASPGQVTGITIAAELTDPRAFVQGLYNDLLGRTGTLAELDMWVSILNSQGQTAVGNGILRSSESLGRIVDSLYIRFLGRNSDPAGRAAWVSILQHGATLESVEQGFITSPEYLGHINTDFVQSLYINLLGRTGSAAELAAWNNNIQALGLAGIANGFLTSPEYRADNVIADFETLAKRPPMQGEISAFVAMPTDLLGLEAVVLKQSGPFLQD